MYAEQNESHDLIQYLASTPLLTIDQERALTREVVRLRALLELLREESDLSTLHDTQASLRIAHDALFSANFRLVLDSAKHTTRLEYSDRVQWGCIGLMRAIEKFNPGLVNQANGQPYRFSTYATIWIRQFIQRGADQDETSIRLPVHVRDLLKKITRKQLDYFQIHHALPDFDLLCQMVDEKPAKLRDLMAIAESPLSLYKEFETEDGAGTLEEFLQDPAIDMETAYINAERAISIRLTVHDVLQAMESWVDPRTNTRTMDRHAKVLRLRFRINEKRRPGEEVLRTLEEVGQLMYDEKSPRGISRERARKLQRVAVLWIKEHYPDLSHVLSEA